MNHNKSTNQPTTTTTTTTKVSNTPWGEMHCYVLNPKTHGVQVISGDSTTKGPIRYRQVKRSGKVELCAVGTPGSLRRELGGRSDEVRLAERGVAGWVRSGSCRLGLTPKTVVFFFA